MKYIKTFEANNYNDQELTKFRRSISGYGGWY